jgi:general secretion pathway protein A
VALLGFAGVAIAVAAGVGTTLVREHMAPPPAAAPAETVSGIAARPLPQAAKPVVQPVSGHGGEAVLAAAKQEAPLAERLAQGELSTGTDSAFAALFGRWRLEYDPDEGPACEQAEAQGLRCLLQRGTWGELVALNRPTLLVLSDRSGEEHQVVLNRLEGNTAELLAGESLVAVPLGELLPLWYGEYLLLWRPEAGDGRNLFLHSTGTDVLWLRRALGEVRGAAILPSDSAVYDRGLEEAVRDFQRTTRIAVDGIAGAVTVVSVKNALRLAGRPRLREDD